MPFFKDLRRRSRANFNTTDEKASNGSAPASEGGDLGSTGTPPPVPDSKPPWPLAVPNYDQSSSTLSSSNGVNTPSNGVQTPSTPHRSNSSLQRSNSFLSRSTSKNTSQAGVARENSQTGLQRSDSKPSLLQRNSKSGQKPMEQVNEAPPIPPRPDPLSQAEKRFSSASAYSQAMATAPSVPVSQYAPRILSVNENSWVNQKVLLVYGTVGPNERPLDGTVTITHHQEHFPATSWQVTDTHFKALVHLCPGTNDLRLDFSSPKLVGNDAPNTLHTARFRINYMPLNAAPPLQLVILLARDSPGTFDAPPEKIQKEGNSLEVAIRKYRMTAHLWSAFTAEQMYRNGFGRRTFRFDETYQAGTLSSRDRDTHAMRNEARVHVVRSSKTMAEIRDLDVAQQYDKAKRRGDLFSFAIDAVKEYFKPESNTKQYVACLILDSRWDAQRKLITGHAALGGGAGEIQLGIFGSQALHTYPSTIEEVVPALTDCTKTDTKFVAADGGEDSGTWWQAACIGIGAHLHEVGHALGCPHQINGIMEHAYWYFNRTFVTAEPYSTRTKQPGLRPCLPSQECGWHRLDCLRFRSHPCFRAAYDPPLHPERGLQVWAVDGGRFIVTARTGINFIELRTEGDPFCTSWLEYSDRDAVDGGLQRHLEISESDLRAKLPSDKKNKRLSFEVHSLGGERAIIDDVKTAAQKIKMPKGMVGFAGPMYGAAAMEGSQKTQVLFSERWEKNKKILTSVRVHHEFSVHGVELSYEDGSVELFGRRSGQPKDVPLDSRRGESLAGFYVRAGFWVDALAVIMSSGRRSEVFGNPNGGQEFTLLPPRGFRIAGLHGSCGPWLDGFGIIIAR